MSPDRCIFWGKYRIEPSACLPLVCHCLDVAQVLRFLAELPGIRSALEAAAGCTLDDHDLDRLAVLALLHDLGKLNLGFQYKVFQDAPFPPAGHIAELAVVFDDEALQGALAEALQVDRLAPWFSEEGCGLESYLYAVWSHHGRPVRFDESLAGKAATWRRLWQPHASHDPMGGVAELLHWACRAFPKAFASGGGLLPSAPRFQHLFAGLVMLADWLGSHGHWFPIEAMDPERRLAHDEHTAPQQLRAVGLDARPLQEALRDGPADFEARFGFPPRPLQAAVHGLDPVDPDTCLLIAESETGSGKTEAALDWFFTLFAAGAVDGLYFALPTRVAARELYRRILSAMERWFPDPAVRPVTALAVPGYAQVDGLSADRVLPDAQAGNRWQDDEALRRRERMWAIEHPKRFLAATVAVGTIDQALLSTVQTAHAHLRGACLARSLLVVDEVHASDFYMTRLLEHLLAHHLALDGRAMLLSATLGARARARYLAAAQRRSPWHAAPPPVEEASRLAYPRLTLADGGHRPCAGAAPSKRIEIEPIPSAFHLDGRPLLDRIVAALRDGARLLAVLNTVARANALHRALEAHSELDPQWLFQCRGVACPHHGRFAPEDRSVLDAAVSDRLGGDGDTGPVVVVGTQTLEQSLDIDADLLITDLAPADVLLQRIGRLHRHRRPRPPAFAASRCLLLVPGGALDAALTEGGEIKGDYKALGYGSVYEDLRALELTRRALTEGTRIVDIPEDNRRLVEAVTHPQALARLEGEAAVWSRHARQMEGAEMEQNIQAGYALIDYGRCFGDLDFAESGQAVATRLGVDGLRLPLETPVTSPFGQALHEMTIPGHMAPAQPDERVTVEDAADGVIHLRCGGRRYVYSRYGLEPDKETP